tara:strand:+ start:161 stop:361 length:201 start_codon:yes stop_codon:yes gene_type:complete
MTTKLNNGSYTTLAQHLFMIIFIREESGKGIESLLNGRQIGRLVQQRNKSRHAALLDYGLSADCLL